MLRNAATCSNVDGGNFCFEIHSRKLCRSSRTGSERRFNRFASVLQRLHGAQEGPFEDAWQLHRVLWHLEGKVKRSWVGFSARLWLSPLPVPSSDGRATCRNLGYCGQRARSEAAGQRDEHRRFNLSLCFQSETLSALIHRRSTLSFRVVWLSFAWSVCCYW